MVDIKERVTINIDETDYRLYKELLDLKIFDNNLHLFTCAALVGKYIIKSSKKINKPKPYIRPKDNSRSDNLVILKGLAISEFNDAYVLQDEDKMFSLCEEYARTGIEEIYNWNNDTNHDFETKLTEVLLNFYNENNIEKFDIS